MDPKNVAAIADERSRILATYDARSQIGENIYAPWQPAESLFRAERKRKAEGLLYGLGKFPDKGRKVLEIGYGKLGWLADLLSWGLNESDLHGIELDAERALVAQKALPSADLRIGDATELPWGSNSFHYVVVSTVFSSVLNGDVRTTVAREIERVLITGGVVIWYDIAVNNPKNPNVRSIMAKELALLFPRFDRITKPVTLAPPIARVVAPKSFLTAEILSAFPFLRTHLLGILVKKPIASAC